MWPTGSIIPHHTSAAGRGPAGGDVGGAPEVIGHGDEGINQSLQRKRRLSGHAVEEMCASITATPTGGENAAGEGV